METAQDIISRGIGLLIVFYVVGYALARVFEAMNKDAAAADGESPAKGSGAYAAQRRREGKGDAPFWGAVAGGKESVDAVKRLADRMKKKPDPEQDPENDPTGERPEQENERETDPTGEQEPTAPEQPRDDDYEVEIEVKRPWYRQSPAQLLRRRRELEPPRAEREADRTPINPEPLYTAEDIAEVDRRGADADTVEVQRVKPSRWEEEPPTVSGGSRPELESDPAPAPASRPELQSGPDRDGGTPPARDLGSPDGWLPSGQPRDLPPVAGGGHVNRPAVAQAPIWGSATRSDWKPAPAAIDNGVIAEVVSARGGTLQAELTGSAPTTNEGEDMGGQVSIPGSATTVRRGGGGDGTTHDTAMELSRQIIRSVGSSFGPASDALKAVMRGGNNAWDNVASKQANGIGGQTLTNWIDALALFGIAAETGKRFVKEIEDAMAAAQKASRQEHAVGGAVQGAVVAGGQSVADTSRYYGKNNS